jgi:Dyp-type peroxidase family
MPLASNPGFSPPIEPELNMRNIQGLAVPGLLKPHQTLIGIQIPVGFEAAFKKLLAELVADVATAAAVLQDRREFRRQRASAQVRFLARQHQQARAFVGIGFTYAGLSRLTPAASYMSSDAFKASLAARSALLGDPTDPSAEGNPANWKVGATGSPLDALLVVAGDSRAVVTTKADEMASRCGRIGILVTYREDGDVREGTERGHEHFGFEDGVSQPGIRGRASDAADDFITDRHVEAREVPEAALFGYPGQYLVWPGELVLGYSRTSPDPLMPGPVASMSPDWTADGSFLVFRRLRQDVGLFWRTMRDTAARLSQLPGFAGLTDVQLAARLVGRWPSGAPFNRTPTADNPELGAQPLANNYFYYAADTPALAVKGFVDPYPMAKADPAGVTCPWAAHIRKVNVRDAGSDMGANESTFNRRLLRTGVPFGKGLTDRYAEPIEDPEHGNRGLLFLSIQASIEDQFEFLCARWMNDPARPKTPGGHDMLVGENAPIADGVRRCSIFGSGLQQSELSTASQWVIPTGGGYFFVPSIAALRDIISQ